MEQDLVQLENQIGDGEFFLDNTQLLDISEGLDESDTSDSDSDSNDSSDSNSSDDSSSDEDKNSIEARLEKPNRLPQRAQRMKAKMNSSGGLRDNKLIQLEDGDDHSGEWFTAGQSGHGGLDGKSYERVIPERFALGDGDAFMKSIIMNYAQEGKNADGSPNGNFKMTEGQTK